MEITPPLGIALGGRGGPETPAKRVLDPLFAQLLLLKDNQGRSFVLVSFDLVGLPHELSDRIRTRLVQELGVEWNLCVLNASHTHSGPYMIRSLMGGVGPAPAIERDYFDALEEKIVGAARAARKSLRPVQIEVFEGKSDVAINRRSRDKHGRTTMAPNPRAPYDEKVWVMRLAPADGSAAAVVVSYACHAVIAYGFDYSCISADFPGVTRRELKRALGEGTHAQFIQGFAGNVRPRVLADTNNNRFSTSSPVALAQAGKDLASATIAAMKSDGASLTLDLAGASDRPFLPRGSPPAISIYEKMAALDPSENTNQYKIALGDYWLERYRSGEGFALGDPWPIGLIRLATNQWVVHSAGEPCVEWRGKIDSWLTPLKVVTWGYSQEARSYLPTEAMLPEGGYEVNDSNHARGATPAPFAIGIEAVIRESLLRQRAFIEAGARE